MRYFTKEWYELMQQQIGVDGLTKVANKAYSDAEIQAFYERDLKKESAACRRKFERINRKAQEVLEQQDIPEEIREAFCLHDANLLSVVKKGRDVSLLFRKDGGWFGESTPYIRITCKDVHLYEREKGFVIRLREVDGEKRSNCQYLYGELYRTEQGYEVHMLLWTFSGLRYFTIGCKEIQVEDNTQVEL